MMRLQNRLQRVFTLGREEVELALLAAACNYPFEEEEEKEEGKEELEEEEEEDGEEDGEEEEEEEEWE